MNDLGPKELEFLSALKASDEPEPSDRERIRRRVWLAVGMAAVGTSGVGIGTQTAVAATPKLGLFAATTAKVGLVVGLVAGGAVVATQPWSTPEPTKVSVNHRAPQVAKSEQPVAEVVVSVQEEEPAMTAPEPVVAPVVNARSRDKVQAPAPAASSADLDAEIQLLRQARQELQAGQFSQALESLGEHARRFPQGVLASERQASVAIALCRSGQLTTGKARASHYLKRNPKSPLADRVRTSCKLE